MYIYIYICIYIYMYIYNIALLIPYPTIIRKWYDNALKYEAYSPRKILM